MSSNAPAPADSGSQSHTHSARSKLTALARLRSFGGSFAHREAPPPPIVFPPPSWELSDELLGTAPGAITSESSSESSTSSAASNPASPPARRSAPALLESNYADVPPPEPVSFAKRLRALIEALPISLPGTSTPASTAPTPTPAAETNAETKAASPVPPDMDVSLVRMLSSEAVMNGAPGDAARTRVWDILASLRRRGDADGGVEGGSVDVRAGAVEQEEGGVMVYAPLEPRTDSQLSLALEATVDSGGQGQSGAEKVTGTGTAAGTKTSTGHSTRVWVPSTTELSVLTTWWGYRLYLPPPVMAALDGTSMAASGRAAMITAALKWVLDKIPLMLVPPQVRGAVKLLKTLGPLVSYVGVFIAWSWDRIRACDKGNGVVLTATWLLPVAVLPMTWDAGDIYGPRPPLTTEANAAAAATAAAMATGAGADAGGGAGKGAGEPPSGDSGKKKEESTKEKARHFFRW